MPWKMTNKGNKTGEIRIYGIITDVKIFEEDTTPNGFQEELDRLGDIEYLNVYLNTPGGGIGAGNTIYNIIKRHPALVATKVDGIAASMGAIILQAGDERSIAKNGEIYIHDPMGAAFGYASDFRKYADWLDKAKEGLLSSFDRISISRKKLQDLMTDETMLTAREALKMGFVDSIDDIPVKVKVEDKNVTFNDVTFNVDMFRKFDVSKLELFDGSAGDKEDAVRDMEKRFHATFRNQHAINRFVIPNIN